MGQPRLLVVTNAHAGGADQRAAHRVLQRLREGADTIAATTGHPDEIARRLAEHPERRPVAVGGDGTLHLLIGALHARGELPGRAVALVPLGTGNDLARTLGIPRDPAAAAAAVLDGRERELDLLVDESGGVVVNAVHLGVGARASEYGRPLKPWLGSRAYSAGAVLAGLRARGWRLTVTVDGRELCHGDRRVLMVGIGNGRSVGGGTPLTPQAEPDDGLADVVVSAATGPVSRAQYGWLLRHGRHQEMREVATGRGRTVSISGEPVPSNTDGELGAPVSRRSWTVEPRAWRMTVPR